MRKIPVLILVFLFFVSVVACSRQDIVSLRDPDPTKAPASSSNTEATQSQTLPSEQISEEDFHEMTYISARSNLSNGGVFCGTPDGEYIYLDNAQSLFFIDSAGLVTKIRDGYFSNMQYHEGFVYGLFQEDIWGRMDFFCIASGASSMEILDEDSFEQFFIFDDIIYFSYGLYNGKELKASDLYGAPLQNLTAAEVVYSPAYDTASIAQVTELDGSLYLLLCPETEWGVTSIYSLVSWNPSTEAEVLWNTFLQTEGEGTERIFVGEEGIVYGNRLHYSQAGLHFRMEPVSGSVTGKERVVSAFYADGDFAYCALTDLDADGRVVGTTVRRMSAIGQEDQAFEVFASGADFPEIFYSTVAVYGSGDSLYLTVSGFYRDLPGGGVDRVELPYATYRYSVATGEAILLADLSHVPEYFSEGHDIFVAKIEFMDAQAEARSMTLRPLTAFLAFSEGMAYAEVRDDRGESFSYPVGEDCVFYYPEFSEDMEDLWYESDWDGSFEELAEQYAKLPDDYPHAGYFQIRLQDNEVVYVGSMLGYLGWS